MSSDTCKGKTAYILISPDSVQARPILGVVIDLNLPKTPSSVKLETVQGMAENFKG